MIIPTTRRSPRWRLFLWGSAALLLALPWVAMQFTAEVRWGLVDFVVFGSLLTIACSAFEITAHLTPDRRRRWAAAACILAVFLLVWVELAVGLLD